MPDDWVTPETIQSFTPIQKSESLKPGAQSISLDANGDLAILGGTDGTAGVYSISQSRITHELEVGSGAVTDVLWVGSRAVIATSNGVVKIFDKGSEVSCFSGHAGRVTALAIHPSGEILASVGIDRSYILYDLTCYVQAIQISTNSGGENDTTMYSKTS